MATAAVEQQQSLVLSIPPSVLGPGSEYERRKLILKHDYEAIIQNARKVTAVDSQEDAQHASDLGRLLQSATKEAEVFFTPIKQQIDGLKKPVLADEKSVMTALDTEKRRLGVMITSFNQEQERVRQEAERKAREEAEKAEREAMLARAVELDQAGDHEAAENVLNEPVFAPVVSPAVVPIRVAGQVGKTTYSATVVDLMALVKAVAEGKAPIQCLLPNEQYLGQRARADKEGFFFPGCKLNRNTGTHFRA